MDKLTDEELNNLSDDELFELLDSRSKELNEYTRPIGSYEAKRYTAISSIISDGEMDVEKVRKSEEIGCENDKAVKDKITEFMLENDLEEPNKYVKNIKTNRYQWFD